MAATHEVAPDALPFSDQEYEQLSTSNSNFAALVCKLSWNDFRTGPYFIMHAE